MGGNLDRVYLNFSMGKLVRSVERLADSKVVKREDFISADYSFTEVPATLLVGTFRKVLTHGSESPAVTLPDNPPVKTYHDIAGLVISSAQMLSVADADDEGFATALWYMMWGVQTSLMESIEDERADRPMGSFKQERLQILLEDYKVVLDMQPNMLVVERLLRMGRKLNTLSLQLQGQPRILLIPSTVHQMQVLQQDESWGSLDRSERVNQQLFKAFVVRRSAEYTDEEFDRLLAAAMEANRFAEMLQQPFNEAFASALHRMGLPASIAPHFSYRTDVQEINAFLRKFGDCTVSFVKHSNGMLLAMYIFPGNPDAFCELMENGVPASAEESESISDDDDDTSE